ncbi:MAG: hypothetical protein ACYC6Y_13620 [Thermoguttaceae bacterium]
MGRLLWACILAGMLVHGSARAGEEPGAAEQVVPITWGGFHPPQQPDDDYRLAAELVLAGARCNLAWAPGAAERIEQHWAELSGRQNHDVIRPACAASCALAVALSTGIYDPEKTGMGREEAMERTVQLIRAAAVAHNGESWKYPWQSALWASTLCQAGWLLWDELDEPTRRLVAGIAEFEADRFLVAGYQVPYWNGEGGDTKAEENAWNSMILQVAAAMMPGHARAAGWRRVCSELMVSAYARPQDRQLDTVFDGRPVKDWLGGYNAREDGAVINHGFLHPDYMCAVELKFRAYITQSLARGRVPETAQFNGADIYRMLARHRWESPPYKTPGGPIYVPGEAEVYYPQGTDWYKERVDHFYLLDTYAHLLGWDRDLPGMEARRWMRLRAETLLRRRMRHADRCAFTAEELVQTRYPGSEQEVAWLSADAFLLHWLRACGALAGTGNWLESPAASTR